MSVYMLWYINTQYSVSESSPVMDSRVASCRPAFWKSKNIVRALKFGFHFPEFSRFEHSFYKIFCIFAKTKDRNKIAKAKMTCLCRWVEIHHWCFSQTSSFLDWLSHGNSVEGRSFLKKSQIGPQPSLGFQINNRSFGTRL